jgi:hypothetical protein
MRDALEKKYGKGTPEFFKHAQKLVYAKNEGHPKVNEMWMALEGKGHDETDMSNPEEKREVELAKKAKDAADAILKMHGK